MSSHQGPGLFWGLLLAGVLFIFFSISSFPKTLLLLFLCVCRCVYIQSAIHHLAEEGAACPEIGPSGRTLDLESRNHDEASGGKRNKGDKHERMRRLLKEATVCSSRNEAGKMETF